MSRDEHFIIASRGSTYFFAVVLFCFFLLLPACGAAVPVRELILLTTNDLHGQLDPRLVQAGAELGGFARLAARMNSVARAHPGAVLRLNSGDNLTGPYVLHGGGRAIFSVLGSMGIDAAALGNHEFDRGPETLAAALAQCSFPVVATNISLTPGHPLEGLLEPFWCTERAGLRLLVVGLLTPELQQLSRPGDGITVWDPGSAQVRARMRRYIECQRPDLVIALTHLGLARDRQLARRLPEIDVICGGHSHDLLAAGQAVVVAQDGGRQTVIVQAGSRGAALGVLYVSVAADRPPQYRWLPETVKASADTSVPVQKLIDDFRAGLPAALQLTTLDAPVDCRAQTVRSCEAPIGSFIADSIRGRFGADAALYNGGGIRGDCMLAAGPLTSADIDTMLPFDNQVVLIEMTGAVLRQVLEQSVSRLPAAWGGFLQVAGLRLTISPDAPPQLLQLDRSGRPSSLTMGRRLVGIEIAHSGGTYRPLADMKKYRIATNSFLADGGNGYYQFGMLSEKTMTFVPVRDVVMNRLASQPRWLFEADGRMAFVQAEGVHYKKRRAE